MCVLAHAGAEGDACLTNILGLGVAGAGEFVDSFSIERVRTSLVGSAKNVTEFGARFRVKVYVVLQKGAFELAIHCSNVWYG